VKTLAVRPRMIRKALSRITKEKSHPEVQSRADLIAFCRKHKHEAVRAFGIIIDPISTKAEVLSVGSVTVRDINLLEAPGDFITYHSCSNNKARLFSLNEARRMLQSDNLFHAIVGLFNPEITVAEVIEILSKYGDCENVRSFEGALACVASDKLMQLDVDPSVLERLVEEGKYWSLVAASLHANTPTSVLVEMATSNDFAIVENAQRILMERGLMPPSIDKSRQRKVYIGGEIFRGIAVEVEREHDRMGITNHDDYFTDRDSQQFRHDCENLFSDDAMRVIMAATGIYRELGE
jgi:hypothetical protein